MCDLGVPDVIICSTTIDVNRITYNTPPLKAYGITNNH